MPSMKAEHSFFCTVQILYLQGQCKEYKNVGADLLKA